MTILTLSVGALSANCYLIADDEGHTLCVDPGDEAPRILQTAAEHHLTIEAILLTHAHFDHIGAADAIRAATGAPLWVPRGDAAALGDAEVNLSVHITPFCVRPAERELDEGDTVEVGAVRFTVWHTAGHTAGGSSYVNEEHRVVLTGDTLFADAYGRTDFPGGDAAEMFGSLKRLRRSLRGYTAYPGHGDAFRI